MQDEMVEWCLKYNVTEFHVLKIYAIRERQIGRRNLVAAASDYAILEKPSARWRVKACNPETGEVYGSNEKKGLSESLGSFCCCCCCCSCRFEVSRFARMAAKAT